MAPLFDALTVLNTLMLVFVLLWLFSEEDAYDPAAEEKAFNKRVRYAKDRFKKQRETNIKKLAKAQRRAEREAEKTQAPAAAGAAKRPAARQSRRQGV